MNDFVMPSTDIVFLQGLLFVLAALFVAGTIDIWIRIFKKLRRQEVGEISLFTSVVAVVWGLIAFVCVCISGPLRVAAPIRTES